MPDPASPAPTMSALATQAVALQQTLLDFLNVSKITDGDGITTDAGWNSKRIRLWQETCSYKSQRAGGSFEALWGSLGSPNVRTLLESIIMASQELTGAGEGQKSHLMRSNFAGLLRSKKPSRSELERVVAMQKDAITLLTTYSDAVFNTLDGVTATESLPPVRDRCLKAALLSRAESFLLYKTCVESRFDWSLELGHLDAGPGCDDPITSMLLASPAYSDDPPPRVFFKLVAESRESPLRTQRIVLENCLEDNISRGEELGFPPADMLDLDHMLLTQNLPKSPVINLTLESGPVSLACLLNRIHRSPETTPPYSKAAKIEIAHNLAESALFLLGTPWFATLNDSTLSRYRISGQQQYYYMLNVPTLDPSDFLPLNPDALAETSQLYRVGVLLSEIALGRTVLLPKKPDAKNDLDVIDLLPKVERAMGLKYCEATAFCLVYRQPCEQFRRADKYTAEHSEEWKSYMARFLHQFNEQVYLKLSELRADCYGDNE